MGTFLVNVHVQSLDRAAVERALQQLPVGECWTTDPAAGWISVYEQRASSQDEDWIRELTGQLSARVQAPAIAFLVHDSDFVCYWLFENGQFVDEFNSCPDYFSGDEGAGGAAVAARLRGQPERLLRFCREGVGASEIEDALRAESTFAEEQLQTLAGLMDLDVDRALSDFRDLAEGSGEEIGASPLGGEASGQAPRSPRHILKFPTIADADTDDDSADESQPGAAPRGAFGWKIAKLLGLGAGSAPVDSTAAQLVAAAAAGDLAQIERLLEAGAAIDAMGPMPAPEPGAITGRMLGGGAMAVPVTPLVAAAVNKQAEAVRWLVHAGANVNAKHALFGTAVHAAACSGEAEILQLLLESGGLPNEPNVQGQTPLAALAALRLMTAQLDQLRLLGGALQGAWKAQMDQLLPKAGWEQCERILREHGGR